MKFLERSFYHLKFITFFSTPTKLITFCCFFTFFTHFFLGTLYFSVTRLFDIPFSKYFKAFHFSKTLTCWKKTNLRSKTAKTFWNFGESWGTGKKMLKGPENLLNIDKNSRYSKNSKNLFETEQILRYRVFEITIVREKWPYSELFWCAISYIWTEYWLRMRKNANQNNSDTDTFTQCKIQVYVEIDVV